MQPRRHRMRKQQRLESARNWIRSGATVAVNAYVKRYGVDAYTAYDELTAIGLPLPLSAAKWAQRPPSTPRRMATQVADDIYEYWWIMLDGRRFFVVGHTSGGAPYGVFEDEMIAELSAWS